MPDRSVALMITALHWISRSGREKFLTNLSDLKVKAFAGGSSGRHD